MLADNSNREVFMSNRAAPPSLEQMLRELSDWTRSIEDGVSVLIAARRKSDYSDRVKAFRHLVRMFALDLRDARVRLRSEMM